MLLGGATFGTYVPFQFARRTTQRLTPMSFVQITHRVWDQTTKVPAMNDASRTKLKFPGAITQIGHCEGDSLPFEL